MPGSLITRMSRGARVQKPDPPVSSRPAVRVGNTRFAHNKDVPRRAKTRSACPKAAGGARRQYPGLPIARMSCTRKSQIRPSQGGRRRARAIPSSHITRISHGAWLTSSAHRAKTRSARLTASSGARGHNPVRTEQGFRTARLARGARAKTTSAIPARKNQFRSSQGGRRRAGAKEGSPIARMSLAVRPARAKTKSARLKAPGSAHGQYPVRP